MFSFPAEWNLSHSVRHLKPSLWCCGGIIGVLRAFQVVQLGIYSSKVKKQQWDRPLIYPVTHFAACIYSICKLALWAQFFLSAKYTHQMTDTGGVLKVFAPALFFLSVYLDGHLFPRSFFFLLTTPPHMACFSLIFLSHKQPSPIPLSQLPVELAAVQDSADGSVIRSVSPCSLFSSSFSFHLLFFSLSNQIAEENFSPPIRILQAHLVS